MSAVPQYVPEYTRQRPLIGVAPSAGYKGPIHAWFESLNRTERRAPEGSRALCGKRSNGWCVEWDGFPYQGPESIRSAESVSWFGQMCPDCRERLGTSLSDSKERL